MSDSISRADALEEIAMAECGCSYSICERDNCNCSYIARIKALPSAEAIQGEWIDTGNWMGVECSRCKCHSRYVTPFCPQCGARMKGGDKE